MVYSILSYYIKIKQKIDENKLKKEVLDSNGNDPYEYSPPDYYHPDFLTGTTSKILRYDEPLLYKKLFEHFRENLAHAEKLIIIGYGGQDKKVNKIVLENFDYQNKPSYIIDPYAGDAVKELCDKLGAGLIQERLENITADDLGQSEIHNSH